MSLFLSRARTLSLTHSLSLPPAHPLRLSLIDTTRGHTKRGRVLPCRAPLSDIEKSMFKSTFQPFFVSADTNSSIVVVDLCHTCTMNALVCVEVGGGGGRGGVEREWVQLLMCVTLVSESESERARERETDRERERERERDRTCAI